MFRRPLTEFGKDVKLELMLQSRSQEELIEKCREKTGMYIDSSVMYKLLTGQRKSSRIEAAIRETLKI